MTAPFFPVINFQVVIGVCILTRTPIMVLTTGKNYYRKKRYDTVVWPANFFGRFKLQPEKITTGKKRYSCLANGWNRSQITVCRVKIRTPIITKLEKIRTGKKVQSSGCWLEHKTQNTTHTDTTTNKMSRATLPSSGFAPSLSMGRAVVPPNHGTAALQRHAQAATRQGCACCRWFACLGRQNKRHQIRERGGVPWP